MLITQNRDTSLPLMEANRPVSNAKLNWGQVNRENDILSIDYYIANGRLSDQIHTLRETTGGIFVLPSQDTEHTVLKKKIEAAILLFFAELHDSGKQFSTENKLAFTIGKFFAGSYRDLHENVYSKYSLAVEIKGVEEHYLASFGGFLAESLAIDQILYKSYTESPAVISL